MVLSPSNLLVEYARRHYFMEKISELRVDITSSNVVYLNFLVESGNLHDGYKGSHENDD